MPTYKAPTMPDPIEIDEFYGLNESVGETEVKVGEAVKQVNFRITQNYKPQKRAGHKTFVDFENEKSCQGLWSGTINDKKVMIFAQDGKIYEYNLNLVAETAVLSDLISAGIVSLLGTIMDAKTSIWWFESKIYFLNGTDYKYYDGTTFGDVEGYVPTIAIETPPTGGGTDFEEVNLLTGKKKQEFVGDNSSTAFFIRELNIDSDLLIITVDGVTKTETTDFTVDRVNGKITFTSAPGTDANVIIQWNKANAENEALVKNNRYAMDFGPGNDTAVFLWGNENFGNKRIWSGTLDASYFPAFNFTLIGSDEFPITDIVSQYSRQIIFKTNRTYYSEAEYLSTLEKYDYPVYDLNEVVGNETFGGVQVIENNPVSLYKHAMYEWSSTNVESELNNTNISERIRTSLEQLDLSKAVTFDNQKQKELFINIYDIIYIYNYGNDTFYKFDNIEATNFIDIDGVIVFGTAGTVEKRNGYNDNGEAIEAVLELGFTNFGVGNLQKNTRKIWVTIQPYSRTSLDIKFATNKIAVENAKSVKSVRFVLFDFATIDFEDFSFETNRNPQTFRRKLRAKKYAHIKFIFENDEVDEQLTILSLMITAETAGEVK